MLIELTPIEDALSCGHYAGGIDPFSVHRAGSYLVMYVDKGEGRFTVDLHAFSVHPGAFLFVSPRQVIQFDRSRTFGGYLLRFSEDFIHPFGRNEELQVSSKLFDNTDSVLQLDGRRHRELVNFFELFQKEMRHGTDAFRHGCMRASLELMLLHAGRIKAAGRGGEEAPNQGYSHFRKFKALLNQRTDASRNAIDFATELGISYKYLNDLCKVHGGVTAKEMIDNERIAEAKRLLAKEGMSVRKAGIRLGFDDVSNFRKYFKKLTGHSPLVFKENQGKNVKVS
ncbi:MAG: helix-turn-helix domain-containing protein [Flavobacteriales bacterium]